MSCQLSTIANIQDILSITKYLFPDQNKDEKKTDSTGDGWNETSDWKDSEWNWDTEEEDRNHEKNDLEPPSSSTSSSRKAPTGTASWLQDSCMSMSPMGDLLVFACGEKIVYLAQKWDSRDEDVKTKYNVVYEGNPVHQPGETITSVLCLPLASHKRSSEGSPDWTCVIVGFSTGYVRIYTENGTLLINQAFSEDPVVQLRCTTYAPPRSNRDGERAEEICILCSQSLVLIDGFSFYQALKACKNQAARAAATGSDVVDSPLLAYKKWGFTDQEASCDVAPCGYVQPSIFDQMLSDSVSKGAGAAVRTSPYGSHLYLALGREPCINFFHTVQTSVQPQLSDVTKVVASKLKTAFLSAAGGWLGFGGSGSGSSDPKEKKAKIEPDVPLTARFGLYDKRRTGERVALSPDSKMAATTDTFGRVILLDVVRGVAVRMWKGYRDAQVGWIESTETIDGRRGGGGRKFRSGDNDDEGEGGGGRSKFDEPRRTCFLVIYAPRRGILEVWSAQSGPRVAAFSVPRTGRLFYPSHGMLGLNRNSEVTGGGGGRPDGLFFFDVDGSVKNLSVPFHLVFSGKNSKRTRDAHLLKQLAVLLKTNRSDSASLKAEAIALYRDINTCPSQRQFLEKIVTTKYLKSSTMREVLECALESLPALSDDRNDGDSANDHPGSRSKSTTTTTTATMTTTTTRNDLSRWCCQELSLLDLYEGLARLSGRTRRDCGNNEAAAEDAGERGRSVFDILTNQLKLEEHEASSLAAVLERRLAVDNPSRAGSSTNQKSVAFEEKVMTPEEFLACFELRRKTTTTTTTTTTMENKKSLTTTGPEPMDHGREGVECDPEARMDLDDNDLRGVVSSPRHRHQQRGSEEGGEVRLARNLPHSKLNDLGELVFEVVVSHDPTRLERLQSLLASCRLPCEDLCKLLVVYVLSLDLKSLTVVEPLATLLTDFVARIYANRKGDESLPDFLLDSYAPLCSRSENILSALVLVLIGRLLSNQVGASSSAEQNSGWEEIHLARERWSQMTRQFQDLLAVDNLLGVGRAGSAAVGISLDRVVEEGRGIIPETIGKFVCSWNVPSRVFGVGGKKSPAPLSTFADESPSESAAAAAAASSSVGRGRKEQLCKLDEKELAEISMGLEVVRRHLPMTASDDVMLANGCWEFVASWNRDPEVTGSLELALEYLGRIANSTLQKGLAKMIWEMFVVKRLSSAVLLTEKVGKSPKDRLIRKDVGLSEKSLSPFLAYALELLKVFLEDKKEPIEKMEIDDPTTTATTTAAAATEEEEEDEEEEAYDPTYDVEDAWVDCGGAGRKSSLLELATNQAPVEPLAVKHHRTLCIVMKAVTTFTLKSVKVFSLFDLKGRNAFFKPLHQVPQVSMDVPDESVRAARIDFVERIVVQSVCLLGDVGSCDSERDVPSLVRDSGFDGWRDHVAELTRLFAVDPDFPLVRFAYQLFVSGYDAMAIELLPPVADRNEAGRSLMPVLASRLHPVVLCLDAKLQARRTCICSTCLVNWIRSQDPKILRCSDVPLSWTLALAKLLTKLIDEDHPHFQLAKEAFDLIPNFE